jgi:polyisoprenoid-binding protein YceI
MTTTATQSRVGAWTIDPAHTLVEFAAKHMMITTVKGRFTEVRGTITIDEADPARSAVEVEIDAASLHTGVAQRDQHLRSADFLEVEKYATITFRSKRIEGHPAAQPGSTFKIIGDLTIRGQTRDVPLDVTYDGQGKDPWGKEKISFSATGKIDRRDFGLTWNAVLEAGGVLVGNDIKISVEVQAVKREAQVAQEH